MAVARAAQATVPQERAEKREAQTFECLRCGQIETRKVEKAPVRPGESPDCCLPQKDPKSTPYRIAHRETSKPMQLKSATVASDPSVTVLVTRTNRV
jgi:hypothetical protein